MDELSKHRTPEQEVVRINEQTPAASMKQTRKIDLGLARYFQVALERLDYLEYGDPSEYLLRTKGITVPNSPLGSIWVPPRFRRQEETGDEVQFDTLIADPSPCQLILADPGCGKSTLARFLTCLFINRFRNHEQDYFGLFVPLSTIRLSGKTYQEAVAHSAAQYFGLEKDADVIKGLIDNISHACIIFDGLDELPVARKVTAEKDAVSLRQDAAALIRSIRFVQTPQTEASTPRKLIVTCRSKDYFESRDSNLGTVPYYFMSKFSPAQMNLAVFKWHESAKKHLISLSTRPSGLLEFLDERRQGIQSALREHSDLATVCLTPLMLSAFQTVYSDAKDLPSSVSQLCWRAINWFFIDKHRETSQDSFVKEYGAWLLDAITKIGWHVHECVVSGRAKSFDNDVLRKLTKETCNIRALASTDYETKEDAITRVASFLRRGHGILVKVSLDEFDFIHNVFREVLAGRALGKLSVPDRRKFALNELWHGPIRYWAGLRAAEPDGLYEIGAFVGELTQDVDAGSTEAVLARGEMLVEVCLIVSEDRLTRDLKAQISKVRNELCALLKSETLHLARRIRIGDLLGTLGDPRLTATILDRIHWVSEGEHKIGRTSNHLTRIPKYQNCPAAPPIVGRLGRFGIGSYLVTNAEFKTFIDAGGYTVKKYWPSEIGWNWACGEEATIRRLIKMAHDVASVHLSSELAGQRLVPDEIPDRCNQMIKRKVPLYWADPAFNRSNQPVVGINWWEAIAYCLWLEANLKVAGKLAHTQNVRLPIEPEWEAVARQCGNGNMYPWVTGEPADCALVRAAFNSGSNPPIFRSCGVGLFQCVNSKLPVYDLVGNVWEWTASKARPYNALSFKQHVEASGLEDRIARGSSWLSSEEESTQITFRSFDPPYNAYEDLGFRIVISEN